MNDTFKRTLLEATGATRLEKLGVIQSLWSGYGKIVRYRLTGSEYHSVVVKHVHWPEDGNHPRGWNTDLSHERKLKSYQVEMAWYSKWAARCDDSCRIPHCLSLAAEDDEVMLVLEDLDDVGFPGRCRHAGMNEIRACLSWLANFHATFMGDVPEGLWASGTYWHLETRPDELKALDDAPLKAMAEAIDQKLKEARYQTVVHGDAKLANFCFSKDGTQVSAVDFQYVGGGCGMKDVAYFIGSCLDEEACEEMESELLVLYFDALREALERRRPEINAADVEQEWRALYPVAWTDFHRFLKGWSPGHWKIHSYSERLAREVVAGL